MVLSLLTRSFLLGLLAFLPSLSVYARPVVISIDAGSNNGAQIGTFIGLEAKKNFPELEKRYDSYLAFLLSPSQFKQLLPQVNSLKAAIDPDYQAEVNAIAAVWQLNTLDKLGDNKLSVNEFWLLQLLPDLTAVNKGSALAIANRSDKNPIAARNLDWKSTPELRSLQTINIYQYEDRTLVSLGFAGLAGVINGFNDQGLFVSLLDATEQQASTSLLPQNSSSFDLRTLLKHFDKIAPAGHELAQKSYSRGHQVLFADQGNIAVLEQPAGEIGKLRKTHSAIINEMPWNHNEQLAVVNCFVLKASANNCYMSRDHYRWGRFAYLLKAFFEQNMSVGDVITVMQDQANIRQAIFNEDTLQSIIFTPKDRALYLYTQAVTKSDEAHPSIEKYQLIQTASKDKLIETLLLVLGIGILAAAWLYVLRNGKKNKRQPLSDN